MSLKPLSTSNSLSTNFNQINEMIRSLQREQTVKAFKQPGGNAIINGKLPYEGGYGSLYYDSNNIPSIIIGIDPDGDINLVVAAPGVNVIDLFT